MVKKNLISKKYVNDGIALAHLNGIQKKYIEKFINDKRIIYKKLEKCPICNYKDFSLIAEKTGYGIPLNTVVCHKCGLIFTLNQMLPDTAAIFYSEYYRIIYEGTENPINEYLDGRYKSASKGKIPKFLRNDSVIVEIGTGGGWGLMKYKCNGFEHYGFDYDKDYINFGKARYGLNLYLGGVVEAKNLAVKADYILLSHVLEHTINPLEFLTEMQDIMKNEAILNIVVPSANYLITGGGDTGYSLLETLQNAHNFLFDEFTLKYLALKSGYGIKVLLGGNMILRKDSDSSHSLEMIENDLNNKYRGAKVIKYLKLCESLVPIKNKIISSKISSNLHYIYYFLKPFELTKKYLFYRRGIIF